MNVDTNALVAIDVETSGPNPTLHQILAVSFVPVAQGVSALTAYVRHEKVLWSDSGKAYFKTYQAAWEREAQPVDAVNAVVSRYLQTCFSVPELWLVGHNVGFDISFLRQLEVLRALPRLSHRAIDTHTMLRLLNWLGRIPESACSSAGAFEYFKIPVSAAARHTSLGDAQATRILFLKLLEIFEEFDASKVVRPTAATW
jgi:DNA polymerase III epsilon subunit-like protein